MRGRHIPFLFLLCLTLVYSPSVTVLATTKAVTIRGDFVPDAAGSKPPSDYTWRVPWRPDMTISTAWHDAGIHPLHPHGELTVRIGGHLRKVRFPFKTPADDLHLGPGDSMSLLYLLY